MAGRTVLVTLLVLGVLSRGVASQAGDPLGDPRAAAGSVRVNGPTGISVKTAEERNAQGPRIYVNGPTGTSIAEEEEAALLEANRDRSGDVLFQDGRGVVVNGPTAISVGAVERGRSDAVPDNTFVAAAQEPFGDAEGGSRGAVVNGPTGISVAAEELEEKPVGGRGKDFGGGSLRESDVTAPETPADDGSLPQDLEGILQEDAAAGRGVFSTDPKHEPNETETLPAGLHVEVADGWREGGAWNSLGGDWALVTLPDSSRPNLLPQTVPGPAYVVVTTEYLKKVHLQREVDLHNATLHYRFFLSQGQPPTFPVLKVYQVVEDRPQLLASEESRGAWSDRTVRLPHSGAFKIVFEAQRMRDEYEIAVDDITLSWFSPGENASILPDNDEISANRSEITTYTTIASNAENVSVSTYEAVTPEEVTENATEETEKTDYSNTGNVSTVPNFEMPSEDAEELGATSDTDSDLPLTGLTGTDGNATYTTVENGAQTDENVTTDSQVFETGNYTDSTTTTGFVRDDSTTEDLNITAVSTLEGNSTDGSFFSSTTVDITNNGTVDVTTSAGNTSDATTTNATMTDATTTDTSALNVTEFPVTIQTTGEVFQNVSTDPTAGFIPFSQSTTATSESKTPLTATSTLPSAGPYPISTSGANNTIGELGEEHAVTTTSWRAFQFFLVVCVVGLFVLGFLYWRRKKRQEDEIPVFTRASPISSDYRNPTFSIDDDSSFVSRGAPRHSYRSFD